MAMPCHHFFWISQDTAKRIAKDEGSWEGSELAIHKQYEGHKTAPIAIAEHIAGRCDTSRVSIASVSLFSAHSMCSLR